MAQNLTQDSPIPVRFKERELNQVQQLQEMTELSRSDLIRRACRYAFPRFLAGKVNLMTLEEFPSNQ